jgi:hypothetical protein
MGCQDYTRRRDSFGRASGRGDGEVAGPGYRIVAVSAMVVSVADSLAR